MIFCAVQKSITKLPYCCQSVRSVNQSNFPWRLQTVEIQCQPEIYHRRPEGCTFNVGFVDTGRKSGGHSALLLHDNPGDCYSIGELIDACTRSNFRIIAPNFPGNGLTKGKSAADDHTFTYSSGEYGDLCERFLDRLDAYKLDSVIGIGHGCYTAILLASLASSKFRSVCLIDPLTSNRAFPANWPLDRCRRMADLWSLNWSVVRWALRRLVSWRTGGLVASLDGDVNRAVGSLLRHANADREMIRQQCGMLGLSESLPVTIVYTRTAADDRLSSEESLEEIMGLSRSDWLLAGDEGQVVPVERKCAIQLGGKTPAQLLAYSDPQVADAVARILCGRVSLVTAQNRPSLETDDAAGAQLKEMSRSSVG